MVMELVEFAPRVSSASAAPPKSRILARRYGIAEEHETKQPIDCVMVLYVL